MKKAILAVSVASVLSTSITLADDFTIAYGEGDTGSYDTLDPQFIQPDHGGLYSLAGYQNPDGTVTLEASVDGEDYAVTFYRQDGMQWCDGPLCVGTSQAYSGIWKIKVKIALPSAIKQPECNPVYQGYGRATVTQRLKTTSLNGAGTKAVTVFYADTLSELGEFGGYIVYPPNCGWLAPARESAGYARCVTSEQVGTPLSTITTQVVACSMFDENGEYIGLVPMSAQLKHNDPFEYAYGAAVRLECSGSGGTATCHLSGGFPGKGVTEDWNQGFSSVEEDEGKRYTITASAKLKQSAPFSGQYIFRFHD